MAGWEIAIIVLCSLFGISFIIGALAWWDCNRRERR